MIKYMYLKVLLEKSSCTFVLWSELCTVGSAPGDNYAKIDALINGFSCPTAY